MKVCIVRQPFVQRWAGDVALVFLRWVTQHSPLRHSLKVYLCPTHTLRTCKGPAYGFFTPGRPPFIAVACRRKHRTSLGRFTDDILETLAHEWCEYEKWRDGRVRNHRGIQNRIDYLIRRFRHHITNPP